MELEQELKPHVRGPFKGTGFDYWDEAAEKDGFKHIHYKEDYGRIHHVINLKTGVKTTIKDACSSHFPGSPYFIYEIGQQIRLNSDEVYEVVGIKEDMYGLKMHGYELEFLRKLEFN